MTLLYDLMKNFILARWLFMAAGTVTSIFMNIFIFSSTHSLHTTFLYDIFYYGTDPFIAFFSVYIAKRSNIKLGAMAGIIFFCLQLILIVFARSFAINHVYILGIVAGIGLGLYYPSTNLMIQKLTNAANRERFNGVFELIYRTNGVVIPVIASFIVFYTRGFSIMFLIVLIVYLCSIGIFSTTPFLPIKQAGPVNVFSGVKKLLAESDTRKVVLSILCKGIFDLNTTVILPLIGFTIIAGIRQWGLFVSIIGMCSMLMAFLYGRWAQPQKERRMLFLVSLLYITVGIMFSLLLSNIVFLFFWGLNALVGVVTNISYNSAYQDVIEEYPDLKTDLPEYYFSQELFINAVKVAFLLFLYLSLSSNYVISLIRFIVLFVCAMPLCIAIIFSYTRLYRNLEVFEELEEMPTAVG